ncbi:MAG: hypothetical protein EOP51_15265 [Sphingobacteriales bacterium]|nr:MAG: hypothetical protein EOP51_15265 [Sphingobacteriales bacterium]
MKQLLLLLFFCFSFSLSYSQQLLWERPTSSATKQLYKGEPLPAGGFVALYKDGQTCSVSRLDSLGYEVWSTPFPQTLTLESFGCLLKVVPGGIIAGFRQPASTADTSHLVLFKLNMQGGIVWSKQVPTGRNHNNGVELFIHAPNEYIVLVVTSNVNMTAAQGGGPKFVTVGIDSMGNHRWHKQYLDPLPTIEEPKNIFPYKRNGYILAGRNSQNGGSFTRLMKTDELGNVLQSELFSTPFVTDQYNVRWGNFFLSSDGNIVFTGVYWGNNVQPEDNFILVTKVDTAFNHLWTVSHSEPGGMFASSKILEMADSTLLLVTQQHNNNKVILVKISQQGVPLDTSYITVSQTYSLGLMNSFLLPDSSLIYASFPFIAKIGNVGLPMPPREFTPVIVGQPEQFSKANIALGKAYPNPAGSSVTVPYSLPKGTSKAMLQIAEVATGRLVNQVNLNLNAEQQEVSIAGLKPGLYTYTLMLADSPAGTKKLVVLK